MSKPADIAFTLACDSWSTRLPGAEALCRRAVRAAFGVADRQGKNGAAADGELGVVLADDATLRDLNQRYRGIDRPTNVLAFPLSDSFSGAPAHLGPDHLGPALLGPALLGDVVIALETAAREAGEQGRSLGDHVAHLVVHGTLHLMGYDHGAAVEAEHMERLEVVALAGIGVADPYRDGREVAAADAAGALGADS